MSINYQRILILLFISILYGNSLFSQRIENFNQPTTVISATDIQSLAIPPYRWISYQGKFLLSLEEKVILEAQLFFVNRIDSIVYLNISISGIELARASFTPDSIIFVNKTYKTYYRGDYSIIKKIININMDFSTIQAIFNAKDFPNNDSVFKIIEDSTGVLLIADKRMIGRDSIEISQRLNLNNSHQIVSQIIDIPECLEEIEITYQNYNTIGEHSFYNYISIETSKFKYSANIKNIKIDIPGTTNIRIPNGFKPIEIK